MSPEENKISLIVKSADSSAYEIRLVWEKRSELPGYSSTNNRMEVIDNYFWIVVCRISMMFNLVVEHIRCDFENSSWSIRQVHQNQFLYFLTAFSPNHHTRVPSIICILTYLINTEVLSRIIVAERETRFYFL